jgi:hypothetical protein
MNRNKLITVAALAVLAFACSETVGGMMQDAGTMLADAGDMMQPDAGAQDTPASCNKSETRDIGNGASRTWRWAEFDVDPGVTEVSTCRDLQGEDDPPYLGRDDCFRRTASWFNGTSIGFVDCGGEVMASDGTVTVFPPPLSITVHN